MKHPLDKLSSLALASGLAVALTAALGTTPAWALPILQLDTSGGVYDPVTETTIATTNPFTLRALIDGKRIDLSRNFYLSAAIVPSPGMIAPDFGTFTVAGITYSANSGMQWGIPPVDSTMKNLPGHDVYPTWYAEILFSAIPSQTVAAYNVQDDTTGKGLLNYVDFGVDIAGLINQPTSPYAVHFDLYTYDNIGTKIDKFAPFSHDAESGHGITVLQENRFDVPDGGATVAMLGISLLGLRFVFRRKG